MRATGAGSSPATVLIFTLCFSAPLVAESSWVRPPGCQCPAAVFLRPRSRSFPSRPTLAAADDSCTTYRSRPADGETLRPAAFFPAPAPTLPHARAGRVPMILLPFL